MHPHLSPDEVPISLCNFVLVVVVVVILE